MLKETRMGRSCDEKNGVHAILQPGDDPVAFMEKPFQFFIAERMGDSSFFILFQRWRREDIRLPAFAEIPDEKADDQRPGVTGIHIFWIGRAHV